MAQEGVADQRGEFLLAAAADAVDDRGGRHSTDNGLEQEFNSLHAQRNNDDLLRGASCCGCGWRRFVAPPNVGALSCFDLLGQSHGDQLRCDLLGCGALQTWRSGDAAVLALCGGAEHQELRVGEFDGHGLTLRVWELGLSDPSPGRAPDRCDRRGEGCPRVILDPAVVHIHALFRRERQSFLHAGALIPRAR